MKTTRITHGAKLTGAAMPRILSEFQKLVVGKTIVQAGYVHFDDQEGGGVPSGAWPFLLLNDKTLILAQADDEMNGPGVLVAELAPPSGPGCGVTTSDTEPLVATLCATEVA